LVLLNKHHCNGVNTNNYYNWYLSQYSYPDGALELDVSLDTYLPSPGSGASYLVSLFESNNGKLYVKVDPSAALQSKIYEINLNSPYIFTQVWDDASKRAFYTNSSINCNTVALNTQPVTDLGCVYYSTKNSSEQPETYLYNVATNASTQVILPNDTFIDYFAETHTSTKYWKGNQTNTIKEWNTTSTPNTLTFVRNITISGITGTNFNYFNSLQAIDNTTLLTAISSFQSTAAGNFVFSLTRMDITTNTVGPAQQTSLFNIYAPAGLDSMLLTTNNKLITVGRRNTETAQGVAYLSQYSYPDGALEADRLLPTITQFDTPCLLFESNGNLYMSVGGVTSALTSIQKIYQVNLNDPYILTQVGVINLDNNPSNFNSATFNSSINCNTSALSPAPSPPAPTPSLTPPVSPNVGVNTIYKYLDIL